MLYQEEEKNQKEDEKLFKAAINDRVGIYNVSLHSLSLLLSLALSLPPLSPKKTKSNACRRCPLLLLLLLRKNVNQCHLTTQMQKTKRFKYIHKLSLSISLLSLQKRGAMRLFF